jgi:hypothetical protein
LQLELLWLPLKHHYQKSEFILPIEGIRTNPVRIGNAINESSAASPIEFEPGCTSGATPACVELVPGHLV